MPVDTHNDIRLDRQAELIMPRNRLHHRIVELDLALLFELVHGFQKTFVVFIHQSPGGFLPSDARKPFVSVYNAFV
jgi:hypothetical protein